MGTKNVLRSTQMDVLVDIRELGGGCNYFYGVKGDAEKNHKCQLFLSTGALHDYAERDWNEDKQ